MPSRMCYAAGPTAVSEDEPHYRNSRAAGRGTGMTPAVAVDGGVQAHEPGYMYRGTGVQGYRGTGVQGYRGTGDGADMSKLRHECGERRYRHG